MAKHNTFTYTARNKNNLEKVTTFTLVDDRLKINLTGLLDQAQKISSAETALQETQSQIGLQAKPLVMKMLENVYHAGIHINDARVHINDGRFKLTAWYRAAGLRLAPITINMGEIDNPAAAEAFADEISRRQKQASPTGKFFGPLDYWFGWVGLLFVIFLLIRKKKK